MVSWNRSTYCIWIIERIVPVNRAPKQKVFQYVTRLITDFCRFSADHTVHMMFKDPSNHPQKSQDKLQLKQLKNFLIRGSKHVVESLWRISIKFPISYTVSKVQQNSSWTEQHTKGFIFTL